MHYYILENDELIRQEVEELPQNLETIYQQIRKKYAIKFERENWADDDRDAGMGYCYDNSYTIEREPLRSEMVFENDQLIGLYVGIMEGVRLESDPTKKYFLKLEDNANIYERGTYSKFYGDSKTWTLIIPEEPLVAEYVYLGYVPAECKEQEFTPEDFGSELIEGIEAKYVIKDSRGDFNNAFSMKLKLTEAGASDPDRVLRTLEKYRPVIINK